MSESPKSTPIAVETINPKESALAKYVGPLQMPKDGTEEATRFRLDASQMMTVLEQNEVNPKALVLWDGVPRIVGDLVRAWRKETYTSEAKRLHRK